MEKVLINSTQGESGIVNVVRYFLNNNNEYLIYSLNEVDESGYTRLYVTKLNGMNGAYTGEILDDNEWNEVKNLVKVIVKANKEGMPVPVQDLNPKKITNITLKDKKVFKLNAPLVNDLSNNKNYVEDGTNISSVDSQPQNFGMPNTQPDFGMPTTPSYDIPQQPTSFDMPSTSPFDMNPIPQQDFEMSNMNQSFDMPNTQNFGMQNTQNFGTPNTQPDFGMPNMNQSFDIPNTQNYGMPQNNSSFDIPNTQPYDLSNMNQTSTTPFEMPQPNQNYEMPNTQPDFGMPNTHNYGMSNQQPDFGMPTTPSYEMPNMNQGFNTNNNLYGSTNANTNDYKAMYDEEVSKNTALQEEINKLNDEINKYKSIVNNIKNVIE